MTDLGNVQAGAVAAAPVAAPLALVLVMLVICALDVPLVITFTVARSAASGDHA